MPFRTKIRKIVPVVVSLLALNGTLHGQGAFEPQGGEYSVVGPLAGDQVHANLALGHNGGYLVWQDNHTDGDGLGISAVRLNSSSTAAFDPFRVNSISTHNQELPQVAELAGGNYLFVWQGGPPAKQGIFARVLDSNGLFLNNADVPVNTHTTTTKLSPAVAGLDNGNGIVVWSSFGQDDAANPSPVKRGLQGVYAQLLSPSGQKIGAEFRVNDTVELSQRTPVVSGLKNGDFLVVWVTEHITGFGDRQDVSGVNIMGRIYSGGTAAPLSGEFTVNSSTNICANPSVVSTSDGGFTVAWSENNRSDGENSWDIAARHFSSPSSVAGQTQHLLNTHTYGDQFAPRISGQGSEQLVVWTSLGQDGSREGVFGRFLSLGQMVGDEFLVNSKTVSMQVLPAVSAQDEQSMLVVWSSFIGGPGSVDLRAQRYAVAIPRPGAPIISAMSPYELFVGWPEIAGFEVAEYHLYIDGGNEPVITPDIFYTLSGLNPGTTHSLRMAYKLVDGRVSPLSEPVAGKTWGGDFNFDGLPDDWQREQFGNDSSKWGGPLVDTDGDGVNNLNEFLAGTRANDAASVLKMNISKSAQGWQLYWNSVPGLIYKVQASDNFNVWSEVGGYRFSAGLLDSAFVQPDGGMEYYRVIRIR